MEETEDLLQRIERCEYSLQHFRTLRVHLTRAHETATGKARESADEMLRLNAVTIEALKATITKMRSQIAKDGDDK